MAVCNQYLMSDQYGGKKHTGTIKCAKCGEESNINLKIPFTSKDFIKHLKMFKKLHTLKGCNVEKLNQPHWLNKKI